MERNGRGVRCGEPEVVGADGDGFDEVRSREALALHFGRREGGIEDLESRNQSVFRKIVGGY